jgi:hypothetical protein
MDIFPNTIPVTEVIHGPRKTFHPVEAIVGTRCGCGISGIVRSACEEHAQSVKLANDIRVAMRFALLEVYAKKGTEFRWHRVECYTIHAVAGKELVFEDKKTIMTILDVAEILCSLCPQSSVCPVELRGAYIQNERWHDLGVVHEVRVFFEKKLGIEIKDPVIV